ncbi:MAG TPA: hypothetical protein VII66_01300 [Gemmatimonadaceae bacterium]
MKPTYTGQRSVPSTDKKFRPKDEHLLEKNKEEFDEAKHGDNIEPLSGHHQGKFAEIDKGVKKSE